MKSQKLELTWIGKENRARLEPRLLIETKEKSLKGLVSDFGYTKGTKLVVK